jgi:hypothetical protein
VANSSSMRTCTKPPFVQTDFLEVVSEVGLATVVSGSRSLLNGSVLSASKEMMINFIKPDSEVD